MKEKRSAPKAPQDALSDLLIQARKDESVRVFWVYGAEPEVGHCVLSLLQGPKCKAFSLHERVKTRISGPREEAAKVAFSVDLFGAPRLILWESSAKTAKAAAEDAAWLEEVLRSAKEDELWLVHSRFRPGSAPPRWVLGSTDKLVRKAFSAYFEARLDCAPLEFTQGARALLFDLLRDSPLLLESELLKLEYLSSEGRIDENQVKSSVDEGASVEIFEVIDAILSQKPKVAVGKLRALEALGAAPLMVLWHLNHELKRLSGFLDLEKTPQKIDSYCDSMNIRYNRKTIFVSFCRNLTQIKLSSWLERLGTADVTAKSKDKEQVWSQVFFLIKEMAS